MSSGTKVSLAVTVLLIGVLAVYYGVSTGDGGRPSPASADDVGGVNAAAETSTADRQRPAARSRRPAEGVLSESVERVADRNAANDRTPGAEPPRLTPMGPHADRVSAGDTVGDSVPAPSVQHQTPGTVESDKGPVTLPESVPVSSPEGGASTAAPTGAESTNSATNPATESAAANQPASLTAVPPPPNPQPVAPPSTPAPSPSVPPRLTEYVIRENESMWTIALDWFGDGTKWDLIAKANPLIDPDQMQVGQKINLPPKDATREPAPALPPRVPASSGAAGATTHVVASGDTLAKLARSYYGNVAKWTDIYEANRALIGADPGALKVGMKLAIPPARPQAKPSGA
jgi:nucleoid-associated protein YgaU